ncbi:hypothetical protein GLOIN_2v1790377 [Rhizophagus clarus]|uniref:Uncharacterized protein n=1 Tax=Rhizophagus clarus TaxID=94130 RepID=A0A8H3LHH3_9GLOM|nr:hypothetical protein GLOIN_2v1790377 [Rhizophagus clarus]
MKILPKVFPEFANLPNLHINIHLLVHARTYGTLINTQVVDGGADQRLSQPCRGFATMSSNFRNLLTIGILLKTRYQMNKNRKKMKKRFHLQWILLQILS